MGCRCLRRACDRYLGPNGIGKSTSFRLLSGEEVPNLGNYENPPSKDEVLAHFAGTEMHDHLKRVYDKKVRTSIKPQYVDKLPSVFKGGVRDLLKKVEGRMSMAGGFRSWTSTRRSAGR